MTESSQETGCSSLCDQGPSDWAGCSVARLEKSPLKHQKAPHASPTPFLGRSFKKRKAAAFSTSYTCHSSRVRKACCCCCHFSCVCDHIHGSPPGSSVPGILQARILVKGKDGPCLKSCLKCRFLGPVPGSGIQLSLGQPKALHS